MKKAVIAILGMTALLPLSAMAGKTNKQWEAEAIKYIKAPFRNCSGFQVAKHDAGFLLIKDPLPITITSVELIEADRLNGIEWRGSAKLSGKTFGVTTDSGFDWAPGPVVMYFFQADTDGFNASAAPLSGNRSVDELLKSPDTLLLNPAKWECKEVTELPRFPKK